MRKNVATWSVVLVLFFTARVGFAQGTAFTYQGNLTLSGGPANGNYDFICALYDAPELGSRVGMPVTNLAVPVANGLFTATLDFGVGPWNGQSLWMEILVRSNASGSYAILNPLQAITPSPYAVAASNLTGTLPASQISGPLSNSLLPSSPTFSGVVTAGSLAGNGAGVTNVNAATLGGQSAGNFWQLGGNTVSGGQFMGSVNGQPVQINANNQRALLLQSTGTNQAPNVIGGSAYNQVSNTVYGATIGGGGGYGPEYLFYYGPYVATNAALSNDVSGVFGTICGGADNVVSGTFGFVGGGSANAASGLFSTVAGGFQCLATGEQSFVGGGGAYYRPNQASAGYDTVCGGADNQASGGTSSIVGGWYNTVTGYGGFIGGGYDNSVDGGDAMVPGGSANAANGANSFAAGNGAQALDDGAFVWADNTGGAFASTATDQFLIRATNGVGINTTTPNATLTVNGSASKPGGGAWSTYSDVRLKKNIVPLSGVLEKLLSLRGVSFEYIDPAKVHELSGQRIGMIAQEVEKVFPDWVETGPDGYKRLTYRGFEALTVEALRELRAEEDQKIVALEDQVARQAEEQAQLKADLGELKRSLAKGRTAPVLADE